MARVRSWRALRLGAALGWLLAPGVPAAYAAPEAPPGRSGSALDRVPAAGATLKVVTHLHSRLSHTGTQSLEEIARRVSERGIDVFMPTETFAAAWEYGLWPLRGVVRRRVVRPSVLSAGPALYLSEIRELRRKFPGLVVIPGVEASAYYRWEGGLREGLVLTDWHRHLIVLGLEEEADYLRMPVLGNPSAGVEESPYGDRTPWSPYQRLIDYARGRGAVVFWAHPEAPNWASPRPVAARVSIRSEPYPEALLSTDGHHGFGVFLEGFRRVALPGGEWDQALGLYVAGRRSAPAWAFGELDYREPLKDLDVDTVVMAVSARSRAPRDVLEALSRGRFYTLRPEFHAPLVLKRWRRSRGAAPAGCGETLMGTRNPGIELELAYEDTGSHWAEVTLVRGGSVLRKERLKLPGAWRFQDLGNASPRTYYRVMVHDEKGGRLVSNPIFCVEEGRAP